MIIDCLVMAGGRGSRMGTPLKPLITVCGEPMAARVVRALTSSGVCRRIMISASPPVAAALPQHLPRGRVYVTVHGAGFVEDLRLALAGLEPPVLVAPADAPGLDPARLRSIVYEALSVDADVVDIHGPRGPVGLSVHKSREGGSWAIVKADDPGLVDADHPEDLRGVSLPCWLA